VVIGFVGGSDFAKISEQLAIDGRPGQYRYIPVAVGSSVLNWASHEVVETFDYAFAENGLIAYKAGKQLASQSFINHLGEERYKPLVNFILHYLADLDIPIKRYVR
jgi:phosphomannomutase